jgi:NTE family protein
MPTALVFSAGGMFGAWEAGVWKALEPHIRPDLIVGASVGAWNGWAIAGGLTPAELCRDWMDPRTDIIRPFRPAVLHARARELHARSLPRVPFGLTLVEVPRFRLRLVRATEISAMHIAASGSIPGIFPPVRLDGHLYVDGGLRGALPLWAAEEMGATHVIAINCLTGWPWSTLRAILPTRPPSAALRITLIEPAHPLGSIHSAVRWSRSNIERWIALGERDGNRALSSIKM